MDENFVIYVFSFLFNPIYHQLYKSVKGIIMSLLAKHAYIKVEKHVSGLRMERIRQERTLYLYRDKIVRKHREIAMHDEQELSLCKMYGNGGVLTVHA